jgi:hypothetical protein
VPVLQCPGTWDRQQKAPSDGLAAWRLIFLRFRRRCHYRKRESYPQRRRSIVSANHRLNVFGYLRLRQGVGTGVRFGNNPGNATIFGGSGGACKVLMPTAMPAAKGLFRKAIFQSGFGLDAPSAEEATALGPGLLKKLGIKKGDWEALERRHSGDNRRSMLSLYCLQPHRPQGSGQYLSQGHGVVHALTVFAQLPRGFRNRDLRPHVAPLYGSPYTTSQMTYDRQRLRLKGLIHRIPQSHRYTATTYGLKVAFFYSKPYLRIPRPDWTALLPDDHPVQPPAARCS